MQCFLLLCLPYFLSRTLSGVLTLPQVASSHSFLTVEYSVVNRYYILFAHSLTMDIQVAPAILAKQCFSENWCLYPFRPWFPPDTWPGVGLQSLHGSSIFSFLRNVPSLHTVLHSGYWLHCHWQCIPITFNIQETPIWILPLFTKPYRKIIIV